MGLVSDNDITEMIGKQIGVAFVDLDNFQWDQELARSIPSIWLTLQSHPGTGAARQ